MSATCPLPPDRLLAYTHDVNLELSNLCNYSAFHKQCPLHGMEEHHRILPGRLVREVMAFLGRQGFDSYLWFHTYNEPLMDPRLLQFMNEAREACPQAKLSLCSNGFYLNQGLLDELVEAGLAILYLSSYSDAEYARHLKLQAPVPVVVTRIHLDDRISIYDRQPLGCRKPCHAPLNQIVVTAAGDVSLCCLDWKREHLFGNLLREPLEHILQSPKLWEIYSRLSRGDRFLPICSRCDWSR